MHRSFHPLKKHYLEERLSREAKTYRPERSEDDQPTNATILLVDDDHGVLVSLARVLICEGWRVVTATGGAAALERLIEQEPDLMITDLCMADVSGWDLLFHENLQRPSLPIFVITALPPPAVGGADRFATEFFQKPLDLDALVAAIRRRLDSAGPDSPAPLLRAAESSAYARRPRSMSAAGRGE